MPAGRTGGIAICGALFAPGPTTYIKYASGRRGSDRIHTSRFLPCDRPQPASPYLSSNQPGAGWMPAAPATIGYHTPAQLEKGSGPRGRKSVRADRPEQYDLLPEDLRPVFLVVHVE
jgi:hypothetical protein